MALIQPRTIVMTGPQPPAGRQYCMVCIGFYKQAVMDVPGVMDLIKEAEAGNGPEILDLVQLGPDVPLPEMAVGMGIAQALGNQVVQACWTHAAGIKITSILPAQASLINGGKG